MSIVVVSTGWPRKVEIFSVIAFSHLLFTLYTSKYCLLCNERDKKTFYFTDFCPHCTVLSLTKQHSNNPRTFKYKLKGNFMRCFHGSLLTTEHITWWDQPYSDGEDKGLDNVIIVTHTGQDQMNKYPSIKLVMIANICTPH